MEEWKLGYAAGLMDGEGSVQIAKGKSPTCRTGYKYFLLVSICSIREEFCKWMKENFGGSFFQSGKTSVGNPVWHWSIEYASAGEFLRKVYPYLITKRAKVDIALAFQARRRRGGRGIRTAEEWELDAKQKQRIKDTK